MGPSVTHLTAAGPSGPHLALAAQAPIQWSTLAWIIGAAVVAALIIVIIVLVSRRPKSMEDGIAEFSRSLQAVAPNNRSGPRPAKAGPGRPGPGGPLGPRYGLAARGEAESV